MRSACWRLRRRTRGRNPSIYDLCLSGEVSGVVMLAQRDGELETFESEDVWFHHGSIIPHGMIIPQSLWSWTPPPSPICCALGFSAAGAMPDATGKLTPEDEQKTRLWFARHWKAPVVCPVCKSSTWTQAGHVVQMPRWSSDVLLGQAPTYPVLPVYCNTCAHVLFFGTPQMGIAAAEPVQAQLPLPSPNPNPFRAGGS